MTGGHGGCKQRSLPRCWPWIRHRLPRLWRSSDMPYMPKNLTRSGARLKDRSGARLWETWKFSCDSVGGFSVSARIHLAWFASSHSRCSHRTAIHLLRRDLKIHIWDVHTGTRFSYCREWKKSDMRHGLWEDHFCVHFDMSSFNKDVIMNHWRRQVMKQ